MKKVVTWSLVLVLAMGMLLSVSCTQQSSQTDPTSQIGGTRTDPTSPDEASEKVKLRVLATTHSLTKDIAEIPMFHVINEKLNVEVEWEQIRSGWNERKSTILASGDLPDIFIGGAIGDSDISLFKDYFLPLNDLIDDYAPNIQKMFAEMPITRSISTFADGNIYGLPAVRPFRPDSFNVFMINQAWLTKLGLETPRTFDQFYDVLKAFKTGDPNGNGEADEIGFNWAPGRGLFHAMSLIGAYGNYAEDFSGLWLGVKDGEVVGLPTTEDYKNLVVFLHKLYREGLIDQEQFTQDYSQWQNKGKIAGTPLVGASIAWSIEDRLGPVNAEEYVALEPLKADASIDKVYWPSNPARVKMADNRVHITSSCKNKERAMMWLDEFYTIEMAAQGYYGSIGELIELVDGKMVVQPAPEGIAQDTWMWTNALVDGAPMYGSSEMEAVTVPAQSILDRVVQDQTFRPYFKPDSEIYPIVSLTADELDEMSLIQIDLYKVIDEKFAEWVTKGGIEEQWEGYIQQLEAIGVDRMLELYQNKYDEFFSR